MQIKRMDLQQYFEAFQELLGLKIGFNFARILSKNKRLIKQELDDIQEAMTPSPEYKEYERKRMELCTSSSLVGANGQPTIVNYQFQLDPAKKDVFDTQMKELRETYKEELEGQQKRFEEFNKAQGETVDVDLLRIKKGHFPNEGKGTLVDILFDLIDEE